MSYSTICAMRPFDGNYQNQQIHPMDFYTSCNHLKDIYVSNFDTGKVGIDHRVQFSQWGHPMANVKIYKSRPLHFMPAITVSEIITFLICYLQNVNQGHGVQFFTMRPFDWKNEVYNGTFYIFDFLPICDLCLRKQTLRQTDSQKYRHSNGQVHGCSRNLADLPSNNVRHSTNVVSSSARVKIFSVSTSSSSGCDFTRSVVNSLLKYLHEFPDDV